MGIEFIGHRKIDNLLVSKIKFIKKILLSVISFEKIWQYTCSIWQYMYHLYPIFTKIHG